MKDDEMNGGLLDPNFKWKPYADVQATWKKFGFKPTTDAERAARQKRPSNVTPITRDLARAKS